MQALSVLPLPHAFLVSDEFAPVPAKFDLDFTFKLKIDRADEKLKEQEQEFSFACPNPQGSLVTADEIFDNGQIRPIFPVFDQSILFSSTASHLRPPLKKLFIEQQHDIFPSGSEPQGQPEGLLRELSQKTTVLDLGVEDSKEICKKSNSTGFSKLWRFRRDQKLRSNSDGEDAFVLLNTLAPANSETKGKNVTVKKGKDGRRRSRTTSSVAHEKLYVMNRKRKESDKRRSFLPYRQQLVGFFANVNGFSKNLHPF